ncbi:MAG: sigma-70 family RNA polymerase sigma factor [Chloroflexi bacterium]|nr:sigma-70 family RNA polymerase sigma factor [Chloroflexota bacterium]
MRAHSNGHHEPVDWDLAYRDLLPRVFHYFAYRLGDADLAEDLAAATFERAWRGRGRYRQDLGGFEAWLFGIARRVRADHHRRARPIAPLEDAERLPGSETPEAASQRTEDFRQLADLLAGLEERERDLVALKYGAGLTNRRIAALTGLSESNVGTILHRVVTKLRTEWEPTP